MRRATRVLASLAGTILVLAPATAYSEDLRGVISTTRVIREDSRLVGDSSTRIAETWAQEALLARNEQPALRVYAVWFNMFPGDSREYWRPDLLTDSRVVHLWDDERSVGRLYYQLLPKIWERRAVGTIPPQDLTLWDAYLLYAPEARWIDEPPDVISWGSTILLTLDRLNRDLKEALKR